MYRGVPSSLANSSGIFLGGTVHCDLVRPGMALYDGNPTPGKKNPMRPVIELKGRIIQVRHVPKGETVGYGAAFTTTRPSRLATVAVGYGDGYARAAGAANDLQQANMLARRAVLEFGFSDRVGQIISHDGQHQLSDETRRVVDEEVERLGRVFMALAERMEELKEVFGLEDDDLNLNLGPLGNLM